MLAVSKAPSSNASPPSRRAVHIVVAEHPRLDLPDRGERIAHGAQPAARAVEREIEVEADRDRAVARRLDAGGGGQRVEAADVRQPRARAFGLCFIADRRPPSRRGRRPTNKPSASAVVSRACGAISHRAAPRTRTWPIRPEASVARSKRSTTLPDKPRWRSYSIPVAKLMRPTWPWRRVPSLVGLLAEAVDVARIALELQRSFAELERRG